MTEPMTATSECEHGRYLGGWCAACAIRDHLAVPSLTVSVDAKDDEKALWDALNNGEDVRDARQRLGIPFKRAESICDKWQRQGIYESGVSWDLGWVPDRR